MSDLVEAAHALAPAIREQRGRMEAERRLPSELARAMAGAGLFRLWLPKALGGPELHPHGFLDVLEALGRIDGAAAWNVMVGATYSRFGGYLPPEVAREVYADPLGYVAGSINPTGKLVPSGGGYRLSGRWSYGSAIHNSDWLIGNCTVEGTSEIRIALFPTRAAEIIDNWHVGGLRGTGSCDYVVRELEVPAERTFLAFAARPSQPGTLYAMPLITVFAFSVAAVPLGIARGAIDALVELASQKTPTGAQSLLRERASVQADVGRAEALVRAGRAFLREAIAELWDEVESRGEASLPARARVRLACSQAALGAAQAVDLVCTAAGATANFESSPLERFFRDVHAAVHHIAVIPQNFEIAGRVLLGLPPGTPRF